MTHTPVLLQTVIEAMKVSPNDRIIDATAGEGGHIQAFLEKGANVLGIDRDIDQINALKTKFKNSINLVLAEGNFGDIATIAKKNGFEKANGILFDLGLSWRQISEAGRGFSFRHPDEELDMRMSVSDKVKAIDIIKEYSEDQFYEMLAKNAEEINARKIAKEIILKRRLIKNVGDLVRIIEKAVGRKDNRINARVFQAFRMEVNDELENLKMALIGAKKCLTEDGKIVVITFHSVEDRVVKQFARDNGFRPESKRVIESPSVLRFERSAKLRILKLV